MGDKGSPLDPLLTIADTEAKNNTYGLQKRMEKFPR